MCLPAETNRVVQVKYTNLAAIPQGIVSTVPLPLRGADRHRQRGFQGGERESMTFGSETGLHCMPAYAVTRDASLSLSGSNQAREGRLVDALAVRGDEGRDTLR